MRNDHFFYAVDSCYHFKEHSVFLQTSDKRVRLIDPEVKNGKIYAKPSMEPYQKKNMVLIYQKKYGEVAEPVNDSLGNVTDIIKVTLESITRIDVLDKSKKLFKRKRLYHPHPYGYRFGRTMMFIGIIYLALGFITIVSLFITVIAQACYIATMVYGSYDAPEVLVLRSYRDEKLAPFFFGRLLIGLYYMLSPSFVYLFKNNKKVNRFVKILLDQWVLRIIAAKERRTTGAAS